MIFPATYPQLWFTYGPQTKEDETLKGLLLAGATGARLTFSYGTPALQVDRALQLRKAASSVGSNVYIVADLQGEKCRFAPVQDHDEIQVRKDDLITLTRSELPSLSPLRLPLQIPQYIDTLGAGDVITEGDGALSLAVVKVDDEGAHCRITTDGVIHPGRGIIVQKRGFSPRSITNKDRSDLAAVRESKLFDAVAVSFVHDVEDVRTVRKELGASATELSIVAKIETQLGLDNLDGIASEADALMAARGDLALTRPWVELPEAVNLISQTAARLLKPWILATQIAEGLERFAFLTRAEICDLAHWIESGAHGVMLSYETAFGPRPIDAVNCVKQVLDRYSAKRLGDWKP